MLFDRDVYFDAVRASLFGGSLDQGQVHGQNAILAVWELKPPSDDLRHAAYMLATTFHETAATMLPIEEYGRGKGMKYGTPDPQTGQTYYGRGFVQLTWRDNYVRASKELQLAGTALDLEKNAWRALDILIAALVMFQGMSAGWFTGKKLGSYFSETANDAVGARKIINPDDKGPLIAGYHDKFLSALNDAAVINQV